MKKAKQTIRQFVINSIKSIEKDEREAMAKLNESFAYYFKWGLCEKVYKLKIKKICLDEFVALFPNHNEEQILKFINQKIKSLTKEVLRGNFIGGSTSVFSNMAQTYDKQVECEMIEFYNVCLERLEDGAELGNGILDRNDVVVKAGDTVGVQEISTCTIYKNDNDVLYFRPYGKEEKVSSYFKNDFEVIK